MRYSEDRIEKLTCGDGVQRDIHIWEPYRPRMVALAVHGALDHGGNFELPGLFFKKHGIATVAHDQNGHDRKEKVYIPRFNVFLEDLDLMVEWTKREFPGLPIFILAHSGGSLIATHYGLTRSGLEPVIRGFVLSSPYYANKLKAPWIVKKMARVLSILVPRMAIPVEDLKPVSTRNRDVYERHCRDVEDHYKAARASARFAGELLKAQAAVPVMIGQWSYPVLGIIAGDDRIADADVARDLLGKIDPLHLTLHEYPGNYHENFNEPNREQVFTGILEWIEGRVSA